MKKKMREKKNWLKISPKKFFENSSKIFFGKKIKVLLFDFRASQSFSKIPDFVGCPSKKIRQFIQEIRYNLFYQKCPWLLKVFWWIASFVDRSSPVIKYREGLFCWVEAGTFSRPWKVISTFETFELFKKKENLRWSLERKDWSENWVDK